MKNYGLWKMNPDVYARYNFSRMGQTISDTWSPCPFWNEFAFGVLFVLNYCIIYIIFILWLLCFGAVASSVLPVPPPCKRTHMPTVGAEGLCDVPQQSQVRPVPADLEGKEDVSKPRIDRKKLLQLPKKKVFRGQQRKLQNVSKTCQPTPPPMKETSNRQTNNDPAAENLPRFDMLLSSDVWKE